MKTNKMMKITTAAMVATLMLAGCSNNTGKTDSNTDKDAAVAENETSASVETSSTYDNSEDGGHAIEVDGETAEYSNSTVNKTGDSEGDEADFYGENAAVFATNKATLTLSDMSITSDGTHANGVFSYGEGTTVNISDSTINTSGNCSGGIMTTGGGTMNANNLTIHTTGNSSAAIRSDRGGGTVTVTGGSYTTDGKGSPAVYSTADITVNDATLTATTSEGVVVEGKNSVTLNNVTLNASHSEHNSDKSDNFNAVMIYQSMSGDADTGLSKFSAEGGSITNANGDIFFVNNTATDITLSDVDITNNGDGVFLRAAAAGWGSEGSNGGKVNLTATSQKIDGDIIVDDVSVLNLYLKDGSTFNGAINSDGAAGDVYVELSDGAKWTLTADSNIKSLTCDADSIDLNGHKLTVDGKEYTEGSASKGEAIEIKVSEGSQGSSDGDKPQPPSGDGNSSQDGDRPQPPSGDSNSSQDGDRPQPPNGDMKPPQDGERPELPPDGDMKPPKDWDKSQSSQDGSKNN